MPPTPVESVFLPPRSPGLPLIGGAILALSIGAGAAFYVTFQATETTVFWAALLAALVLFAPLPLLAYQAYALSGARYVLERDGLLIRWGLRGEDIPMPDIEWVRPAATLPRHVPLPWLSWPGAILGSRSSAELGPVEFIAADTRRLLLVATPQRIYAISPADPAAFLKAYQRANELGSLSPIKPRSADTRLLMGSLASNPAARWLVLAGAGVAVILLLSVALALPSRQSISLGFTPTGQPVEPGPSARLLLLPVLNGIYYLVDLLAGLFFYRRSSRLGGLGRVPSPVEARTLRIQAYLLWGSSILTGLILLVGAFEVLRSP